jgi:polyisoprenoid-binding protein YceI
MMIANVSGDFSKVTGSLEFDPENLSKSQVKATIDATTVNTREAQRDQHLKSHDFLDVSRYRSMTFQSTSIERASGDHYRVLGELTVRDITRSITLEVQSVTAEIKDPDGFFRRGASARTRIARGDFGLTWNAVLESGGFVVGNDVEITIDVEFVRKPE